MTLPSSPRFRAGALAAGLLVMAAAGLSAHSLRATAFLPEEIVEWGEQVFSGATPYRLVEVDGRDAVHALCEDETASALFHRADIDLTETPVMEWSWRVDATLAGIDETSTSGDDFPARLYVVAQRRILRWRPIAINYVWAHEKPEGADWPNPYSPQVRMVSVRSGAPMREGRWFTERRNVREDIRRFHGREVTVLGGVAVMTDCDDTGQRSEGWYGTIRFVPE
jgi:hypothetical protein